MPAALMDNLEGGTSYLSGSESQSPSNWDKAQPGERTYQRRQRNRDAARKSRKKQTEKADLLHEELQALEQSNAAYVKEIADLKKEFQHYSTLLQQHTCLQASWTEPSVPHTASISSTFTSDLIESLNPNPSPEPQFTPLFTQDQTEQFSLSEFLDRDEWQFFTDI